jgi:K+-sensing histidine kinase KdpD
VLRRLLDARLTIYVLATFGIAVLTTLLLPLRGIINATTIGFAFLLVVVFVAILWGSKPALLASILGMLGFNFFFLPPFHTFTIADPQNWVLYYGPCRGTTISPSQATRGGGGVQ